MAGLSVRPLPARHRGRPSRHLKWSVEGPLTDAAFEQKVRPALVDWLEIAVRRLLERGELVEIRRGGVRHIVPAGNPDA